MGDPPVGGAPFFQNWKNGAFWTPVALYNQPVLRRNPAGFGRIEPVSAIPGPILQLFSPFLLVSDSQLPYLDKPNKNEFFRRTSFLAGSGPF